MSRNRRKPSVPRNLPDQGQDPRDSAREAAAEPQVEGWIFDVPSDLPAAGVDTQPIDALVAEALRARARPVPVIPAQGVSTADPPTEDVPTSEAATDLVDQQGVDQQGTVETPETPAETLSGSGWVFQASVGEQWAPRAPIQVVPAREMPAIEVPVPDEDPEPQGWVFEEQPSSDDPKPATSGWIYAEPPTRPLKPAPEPELEDDSFPVVGRPKVGRRKREPHPKVKTRRRWMQVALVTVLLALCAVVPFAVPQVANLFGDAVPRNPPVVKDPSVAPATPNPQLSTSPSPGIVEQRLGAAGAPLEVRVPRLHVDSVVVPISGQSGELLPPSDPQELGWWQEGRQVGARQGSAVVTGHTVSTGGGAFDHLGELVPGDRIRVRTTAGWIAYDVVQSHTISVAKLAATAHEIFRLDGPGRLVLITCSNFNGVVYLTNSVVYAVPVKDEPFVPTGVHAFINRN